MRNLQAPANRDLPVYWCHLLSVGLRRSCAAPSEGFCAGSDAKGRSSGRFSRRQARATAISGAREDVTRLHYPDFHDRPHLAEWREQLSSPWRLRIFPSGRLRSEASDAARLDRVLDSLRRQGLCGRCRPCLSSSENEVHVVRLVAPPLRLNPRYGSFAGRDCRILGPTLAQEHARLVSDAVYRPPAEQGDIVRVVTGLKASTILLIDGVFAKAPLSATREILWALGSRRQHLWRGQHGCPARRGAARFRHARPWPYLSLVQGDAARRRRRGGRRDDAGRTWVQALSEALVDMRLTLRRAERCGIIPAATRRSSKAWRGTCIS